MIADALLVFIACLYSFFGYFLPESILNITSAVAFIFFAIFSGFKKGRFSPLHLFCGLFMLYSLLSGAISPFSESGTLNTGIFTFCLFSVFFPFTKMRCCFSSGLQIVFYFSLIHVGFTIFSFLSADTFLRLVFPYLPLNVFEASNRFLTYERFIGVTGITDQTGRNAFYISMAASICVTRLLSFRKVNYHYFILLVLSSFSLLLTIKRGYILANLVATIFIWFVSSLKPRSIVRNILGLTVFLCITLFFLHFFEGSFVIVFDKFEMFFTEGIGSRGSLYQAAWDLFVEKPFLGWGLGTFSHVSKIGTHNVYLQLLCEMGVLGFSLFIVFISTNLFVVLKTAKTSIGFSCLILWSIYVQIFFCVIGLSGNPLNDGFILIIYLFAASIPHANLRKKINKEIGAPIFINGN